MTIRSDFQAAARAKRSDLKSGAANIAALEAKARELSTKANVAAAEERVRVAEAAVHQFLFDSVVEGGEGDAKRREALGRQVREARAALAEAHIAAPELADVQRRLSGAMQAQEEVVAATIEAEALALAAFAKHHSERVLHAQEAVQGLALWAIRKGRPGMAQRLREALQPFPSNTPDDPARFSRAKEEFDRSLVSFREAWVGLADALKSDPDATAPMPEEI